MGRSLKQIYFDNNSTTPVEPQTLETMLPFLTADFGNPSSSHTFGLVAAKAISRARRQVADLVAAEPSQVLFCASATEAINWVLGSQKRPMVTSAVEHAATLEVCQERMRIGLATHVLPVLQSGGLDLDQLERQISGEPCTVSLMWANNETGVIFPIEQIAAVCAAHGAFLHVDAVQAAGKVPIDFSRCPIDALVISSHKLFGPKGIAALIVKNPDHIPRLVLGGGQEGGMRAGTENVPAIVGFGSASERACTFRDERVRHVLVLRNHLEGRILYRVPNTWANGQASERLANTSNIGFDGIESETLAGVLDAAGIAVSTGSACHARSVEPSHVVRAMTGSYQKASQSLRFSLSHLNSIDEVDCVIEAVCSAVAKLR
jgi:cysteine desulfurase